MTVLLKTYLFILSSYHLFTGVVSFCTPNFAFRFYRKFYGCDPEQKDMLIVVMKPWGALAFFAGWVGMCAAWDPVRYYGILWGLLILLISRVFYRWRCRQGLKTLGSISIKQNLWNIFLIVLGIFTLSAWLLNLHFS